MYNISSEELDESINEQSRVLLPQAESHSSGTLFSIARNGSL